MSEAASLRADLKDAFGDYGRAISVKRTDKGAYDKATGVTATSGTTDYPGTGRVGSYSDYLVNGTTILAQDRKVTWIPDDITFEPLEGDQVTWADSTDEGSGAVVVRVKRREVGGELICFTMQVRTA